MIYHRKNPPIHCRISPSIAGWTEQSLRPEVTGIHRILSKEQPKFHVDHPCRRFHPASGRADEDAERSACAGICGQIQGVFWPGKNGSNSKKIRFTKKLLDLTDLTTKHGDCKAQSTCDMRNKLDVLSINNRNIKNM